MSKCMLDCIKNYEKHLEDVTKNDGIIATKMFDNSFFYFKKEIVYLIYLLY